MRVCKFDGCKRRHREIGYCHSHAAQYRRGGKLKPLHHRSIKARERDAQGRKHCYVCDRWLHESNYYETGVKGGPLFRTCKGCMAVDKRLRRYNMTREQLWGKCVDQDWKCGVCRCNLPGDYQVDHDHSCCDTGSASCGDCVRGLLCRQCNAGLGSFRDDPQLLALAAEYLAKWAT